MLDYSPRRQKVYKLPQCICDSGIAEETVNLYYSTNEKHISNDKGGENGQTDYWNDNNDDKTVHNDEKIVDNDNTNVNNDDSINDYD